jgi:hypothetical protein
MGGYRASHPQVPTTPPTLDELLGSGVHFSRLRDIADTSLADPAHIPCCALGMEELPGRAGAVACQTP